MALPEIDKTPTMRLIEARDPEGRDVREIVRALYAEHNSLEKVAQALEPLAGERLTAGGLWRWVQDWGWSISRVLVIPDPELAEAL